jgi:hypothetical protein
MIVALCSVAGIVLFFWVLDQVLFGIILGAIAGDVARKVREEEAKRE